LLIQALAPNLAGDILSRIITPLTDAFVGLLGNAIGKLDIDKLRS